MRIHDLDFFSVPTAEGGPEGPVRSLLVRLAGASGLEGWGESRAAWRPGELAARREAFRAVLVGRSIYDIEELHTLEALEAPALRSAVEMAAWVLMGRHLRQPLCNLLGGYYRRRIPIAVRLADCRAKTMLNLSRELAEQGFHTQTLASTGRAEEDARNIRGIREMVGDRIELRLDGMGRFDLPAARDLCAELESERLQFFLDPLRATDVFPVATLGRQTSVPLALWRTIRGPQAVLAAARSGAARFLVIDLDEVGGIVPARACAAIAVAGGLTPVLGGRASLGIATAALLHLAAATAAFSAGLEIAGPAGASVLTAPAAVADGMMFAPGGSGLGVEVDRAKLEPYQPATG